MKIFSWKPFLYKPVSNITLELEAIAVDAHLACEGLVLTPAHQRDRGAENSPVTSAVPS